MEKKGVHMMTICTQKQKAGKSGSALSRRKLLNISLSGMTAGAMWVVLPRQIRAQRSSPDAEGDLVRYYESTLRGIKILPGNWRPHYPWEHIAWVKPPWLTEDYIWLDFPEAIFSNQGLLYLSHLSPRFPQVFPREPRIEWSRTDNGIFYERRLPNGVTFGGSLTKFSESIVNLSLSIRNGSPEPLTDIRLQTCAFLRHSKEFSEFTADNKFVHLADIGWLPYTEAVSKNASSGRYLLGWRSGPASADLPVMVTRARPERTDMPPVKRMTGITWDKSTFSLVTNPQHPCMHADPFFPDLQPGRRAEIHGRLLFYEGDIENFGRVFLS